ncbi:hypothetical protein E1B28_002776 [Marasmius oreades]|uniref:Uncharacterized protein n=1 Tax=Marasmius oreades TaxID=181124 RepID=A0A9P7UMB0_9AGAR|nr:uncharacterized protein E1B28_002776 [Marasmius oreades]KAG7086855.1 hypothetical protein E1B28_002776 [Marasmius oreades]
MDELRPVDYLRRYKRTECLGTLLYDYYVDINCRMKADPQLNVEQLSKDKTAEFMRFEAKWVNANGNDKLEEYPLFRRLRMAGHI